MHSRRAGYRRRAGSQLAGALVLISIGIVFLLVENDLIPRFNLWQLWPLVLVIAGLAKFTHGPAIAKVAGIVLVSLGVVFQMSELGYISAPPHRLWPIVFVAMGVMMLSRTLLCGPANLGTEGIDDSREGGSTFALFGGVERRISDQDFVGAELTAIFGGYEADLRKAQIQRSPAIVKATAIFGGIEMRVPETWNVVIEGSPIFGGYNDETIHPDPALPAPRLIVDGFAIFGGISVKN